MPEKSSTRTDKPRHQRAIDRRKASIMHVFREAHASGDGARPQKAATPEDAARHAIKRRHGVDDASLRRQLAEDLANLLATIRLEAVIGLGGSDYVGRSVINYGFRDLSSISSSELNTSKIAGSIRETLVANEPRLVPDTISVHLEKGDRSHRLKFSIAAEMASDPVDIPVDFVAEVDLGAGKVNMNPARQSS